MKIKSNTGLTLTELLVASFLMSIIMLGIVSFNFAIKEIQEVTNKSSLISVDVMLAMNYLNEDAQKAVGNGDIDPDLDQGSGVRYTEQGTMESICFRLDTNGSGVPNNSPPDYSDDTWVCYYVNSNENEDKMLYRCYDMVKDVSYIPPTDLTDCEQSSDVKPLVNLTSNNFFTRLPISGSIERISFYVEGVYDPTKAIDPIENPSSALYSSVRLLTISE